MPKIIDNLSILKIHDDLQTALHTLKEKNVMEYTVTLMTSDEEKNSVDKFLHEYFLPDLPIARMFGLENTPPPPPSNPRVSDSKEFYLQALDSDGKLIGVAVNKVSTNFESDTETPPEVKKVKTSILERHLSYISDQIETKKSRPVELVELMDFAEEEAELNKLPPETIELRVLSVHPEWRQRGVARRLTEESVNVARSLGFKAMRVCCTSEFTARLVRSLGWREHYRLAYKQYPRLKHCDVYLRPTPPHDYLYYYVTDL